MKQTKLNDVLLSSKQVSLHLHAKVVAHRCQKMSGKTGKKDVIEQNIGSS